MAGFIDAAVLRVLVDVNNSKANAELGRTQKALQTTGRVARASLAALAVAGPAAAGAMVKLASDAEEVESKFKIVFGKEAPNAVKQLDRFSKATGTNRYELRRQAADFQALIRPMGLSTKNASEMSVEMTRLATDLASFNNTSVEEAMVALRSGLVGESEPLRRFGVQLSAARVETYAYAKGIAKQGSELTSAQKAQATYGLILEDTKLAQGDATRTAGSFANQFKRLRSRVTELATDLGKKLLPIATDVVRKIGRFIEQLSSGEGFGGWIVRALENIHGAARPVVRVMRDVLPEVFGALRDTAETVAGWIGDLFQHFKDHKGDAMAAAGALSAVAGAMLAIKVHAIVVGIIRGMAVAVGLLNAALKRNPIILIVGLLAALGAALFKAYEENEEFRKAVDKAWRWIKTAAKDVFDWLKKYIPPIFEAVKGAAIGLYNRIKDAWEKIKSVTRTAWGLVRRLIIDPVRDTFSWVRGAVRDAAGFLGDRWRDIRTVAGEVWRQIEDRIITPIRDARDVLSRVWDQVKDRTLAAWRDIRTGVTDFATSVKDRLENAFKGAANKVIGFVRKIIGVVNKIPGVDIGMPALLAQGGTVSRAGVQMLANGGWTNGPMAIVGEGRRQYPEVVIPTDPQYRRNSLKLMAQAASKLGVGVSQLPTYAKGGQIGGVASDLASLPAKALSGGAKWFTSQLPNPADMLPGWLRGLGSHVIGKVTGYIKDKIKGLFGGILGGKLGNATGSLGNVAREARAFGLMMTSGFRPGDPGWHGRGRAMDFSNSTGPTPQMMAFAQYIARTYGSRLLELIYTPLGFSIKNGQRTAPFAQASHYNHVHVAMARGGMLSRDKAVSGPFVGSFRTGGTVPADGLAQVHKGETITPAGRGGRGALVHVENMNVLEGTTPETVAARLAFLIDTAA